MRSNPTRRKFLRAAIAGSVGVLAGCSPLRLVNGLAPSRTYRATNGLAYGAHPRYRLDVYRPAEQAGPAPVVVFFYGGHWRSGERGDYLFVGEALASRGFLALIPDYRLHPEVRFPAFLEDGAKAVRWALSHAAEHGGDPGRLFLMGHSAGAYNAAMLALNPAYLSAAWRGAAKVRGLRSDSPGPMTSCRLRPSQQSGVRLPRYAALDAADPFRQRRIAAGAARHRGRRFRGAPAEHPAARVAPARKRSGGAGGPLFER